MRAWLLDDPKPADERPLVLADLPKPRPRRDEVLVRVRACAVCRTDLHVIEGELPPRKRPLVPGHQIVGTVEELGDAARTLRRGQRVGIAWLHRTCGSCEFCRAGRENLCDAPDLTGYTVDGGYAEYAVAPEAFVHSIPEGFSDLEAAPLLCAGIIGFRSLRVSSIARGQRLGLYGFGAAAHVAIQVARHWDVEVYAMTRQEEHRRLALALGAAWAGAADETPPAKLDAAIVFAPAGELAVAALRALKKGGTVALGGIHMSQIPPIDYDWLYHERAVRSVANNTRQDARDFLALAAAIPIRTAVRPFAMEAASEALIALRRDGIRGAAVLQVSGAA